MRRWEERLRQPRIARDTDWDGYLELCVSYLARQMIVYEHSPQWRFDRGGNKREKVFTDMNA